MESRKPPPSALVDTHMVPGDVVLDLSQMTNQTIKLGAGLRLDCDTIQATNTGRLRLSKPNKYWVESSQKRWYQEKHTKVRGPRTEGRVLTLIEPPAGLFPVEIVRL